MAKDIMAGTHSKSRRERVPDFRCNEIIVYFIADLTFKAKAKVKDLKYKANNFTFKTKAKDLTFKSKAKVKDLTY